MERSARLRALLGVAVLAAVAAGAAGVVLHLRRPATQIERLTDHPERLRFSGALAPAAAPAPPLRWTADQIAREWQAVGGAREALLRSPALDPGAGIDSIVVALAPEAPAPARLLWSADETPSAGDRARNAQELSASGRPLLETVRGERIGDVPFAARAVPRHLFLEGADARAILALVRAVEVVRVRDRMQEGAGRLRASLGGEIREALHTGVPGEIAYSTVVTQGAELLLGLGARDTPGGVRVTVQTDNRRRQQVVFERTLAAGEHWTDVRVPLPGRGPLTLALRAEAARPGGSVLWGSPMIVPRAEHDGPPNVVVYLMDALRPDHLGFQGYAKPTSPFLDSLAARSLVFRRCYAGASWTKPSVATLLTSLHPQTHGVGARSYGDALPEGAPTLQDALGRQGYVTALFSANPLGGTASGLDRRFDRTLTAAALGGPAAGGKVRAEDLHRPLLAWMEAHAHGRFFAFVHAVDTHPPYDPAGGGEADAYDAAVTRADAALRALYERMEKSGLAARTLLVVTADHGRALGERGQSGHGLSVREEQVRVPLLLHQEGRVAPAVVEAPVHLVDVLPTVLARCGAPLPAGAQGRPLPDAGPPGPRPVFVSRFVFPEDRDAAGGHGPEQVAMVEYPWKLIVTEAGASRPARAELFDLGADAQETSDRAPQEGDRVRRMSRALHAFLQGQAAARAALRGARDPGAAAAPPELLEQLRALGYAR
jgi:arylsulfatase